MIKIEIDALNISVEKRANELKLMDEFINASLASEKTYQFNWVNLWVAILSQAMTSLAGLTLVAYCFKFAKMAGINQGVLPCIFSITTFYVSLLFYLKFNEKLSCLKIIGMILMLPCIGLIAFSGDAPNVNVEDAESETYSNKKMQFFAILSVIFALIAPFFWTTKMLFLRLSEDRYKFNLFDLSIDCQIY